MMGDEKTQPPLPPPPLPGDGDTGPRTSRGRPALPGVVVAAEPSVPRDTIPFGELSPGGVPVLAPPQSPLGRADLSPLPPPAIIQAGLPLPGAPDDDGAPRSSRPPTSIAPAMPQIPKQVTYRPPELAPGIVSTQAIPLTPPARPTYKGPILVAVAAAVIGGAIAFAAFLWLGPKGPSASAAPVHPSVEATAPAPAETTAPASTSAAPVASPAEPSTSAASAPEPSSSAASAPEPSSSAAPSASPARTTSSTTRPAAGPTAPRPTRKSDRIED